MFSKFKTIQDEREILWINAILFAFIVYFESYILNVNYSAYFVYIYDTQGVLLSLPILFCIVFWLYLCFRFLQFSLTTKWYYKTICFVLFFVATFVEFSYQKAFGRFMEPFDIETAVGTSLSQKTISIFLYLDLYAIVPCIVFLFCLFLVQRAEKTDVKKLILGVVFFTGSIVSLTFFQNIFAEKRGPTVTLSAFLKTKTEFLFWGPLTSGKWIPYITGIKLEREPVERPTQEENSKPTNNIVIILDESVRGDHFSLNGYHRKTTPFLEKLAKQKNFHNWGLASSASTGTRFTYEALIVGLKPTDFPDKSGLKINTFSTFFQYAQAMGYKTHFLDGQMLHFWVGVPDDKNHIDEHVVVSRFNENGKLPNWEVDKNLAKYINDLISNSTGNFIFVYKHGSHIPYQGNFPPDEQIWQPSYTTDDTYEIPSEEELPKVVNSYDNSIKYNVDSFFENLVNDYSNIPNNTVFVYTGDHGQTLFKTGKNSHGGDSKAEATVPLFIIGDLGIDVDTEYKASHQNIFPTLLDLMKYPRDLRRTNLAISLLEAKSTDSKPRYFNPNLQNRVPFD